MRRYQRLIMYDRVVGLCILRDIYRGAEEPHRDILLRVEMGGHRLSASTLTKMQSQRPYVPQTYCLSHQATR